MQARSNEISEIIKSDQASKGVTWSGTAPDVSGFEFNGTISNEELNGNDGIGDVYSFAVDDVEKAFEVYRDVMYKFTGTYTNLDPYQFHQVDPSKQVYVQFRLTVYP